MINEYELTLCRKNLPNNINNELSFGHIDKDLFSNDNIKSLKSDLLKTLSEQKIPMWDYNNNINIEQPIGLWGEDTDLIDNDLGIACLFVGDDNHEYALPYHFMSATELYNFVIDTIINDFPELLV